MRRLLPVLALCLALSSPAGALTPVVNIVVNGGAAGWSLPGSGDLYFARNGGSCAINRANVNCANLLSVSRAQTVLSYAQWNDGHWSSFSANTLRITDRGPLFELSGTNQALCARDMTTSTCASAWVPVNITAAYTATGADNVPNAASNLTATAANGTILQTLTIISQAETYSVSCQRQTGTGEVDLTENGGTNWTPISLTSSYKRFSVEATLANPVIGIRIVTNGDSVNCDFNQDEEATFGSSPIPTTMTTATRNADSVQLTGRALVAAQTAKSIFIQTSNVAGQDAGPNRVISYNGGAILSFANSTEPQASDGTNTAVATMGNSLTYAASVKTAYGLDSASMTVVSGGGTMGSNSTSVWPTAATGAVFLGNNSGLTRALNGYIARIAFSPVKGQYNGITFP